MAQADIDIADEKMLPQAVDLHNAVFRPKREVDFFKRRFMGRYNALTLIARMDNKPVGFWIGFELKPGMFYHWLGAVVADVRRHGVGRQLQEAQQAWAKDHGYEYIRCECMNHQREFIHFAIAMGYDIVGIRWDSTHADNLIVFEKNLVWSELSWHWAILNGVAARLHFAKQSTGPSSVFIEPGGLGSGQGRPPAPVGFPDDCLGPSDDPNSSNDHGHQRREKKAMK